MTQTCLETYALIRREGRLVDRALEIVLRRRRALYSAERRAVAERIYDLVRRQITVDHFLRRALNDFERREPSLQDSLRLCAARVLTGDSPERVARDARLGPREASAVESLAQAASEIATWEPMRQLSIGESLPEFLALKFLSEWGAEALRAARALNARAPLTARANTLKVSRDELIAQLASERVPCGKTPLSPHGLFLETRINAFSLKAFRAGHFELQDEGSQLLGMLVDAPPTVVVDACAGAGGKTLQLSAQMKNRGELFAMDIDDDRLAELRRRARRAGAHNVRARLLPREPDAAERALSDLRGKAHRVLIDAPCSGTGTLRRRPDARYRLTPELLSDHVKRQGDLLRLFADLVKPGGRLIYGTCSVLREENEEVAEAFLGDRPDFELMPATDVLGEALSHCTRGGVLRVAPHQHGTDGFFGAVLRRKERLADASHK